MRLQGNLGQPQEGTANTNGQGTRQESQMHCDIDDGPLMCNGSHCERKHRGRAPHQGHERQHTREWAKELGTGSCVKPGPEEGANTWLSGWLCWAGQLTWLIFVSWCWLLAVGCLLLAAWCGVWGCCCVAWSAFVEVLCALVCDVWLWWVFLCV